MLSNVECLFLFSLDIYHSSASLSLSRRLYLCVGYRFWLELLREPPGLHVHPVALLPSARSHSGPALRPTHRHVVAGVHPG